MALFEGIQYVTGGFTLIAFVVAAIAFVITHNISKRERLISTVPESDRAALIEKELQKYVIEDTSSLTKAQKYDLLSKQMHLRSDQLKIILKFSLAALVVSLIFLYFVITDMNSSEKEIGSVDGLKVDFVESERVDVEWVPYPSSNSNLSLALYALSDNKKILETAISSSQSKYSFTNLNSATGYRIRVLAKDDDMVSSPSDLEFYTKAKDASLPPQGSYDVYYSGDVSPNGEFTDSNGLLTFIGKRNARNKWLFSGEITKGKPSGKGEIKKVIFHGDGLLNTYDEYPVSFDSSGNASANLNFSGDFKFHPYYWQEDKNYIGDVKLTTQSTLNINGYINLGPYAFTISGDGKFEVKWKSQPDHVYSSEAFYEGVFANGDLQGEGQVLIRDHASTFIGIGSYFEKGIFNKGELENGVRFSGYNVDICPAKSDVIDRVKVGTIQNWSLNNGFSYMEKPNPLLDSYALTNNQVIGNENNQTICEYRQPR